MFDAQSLVFGKFLAARNGYDFIGALVDSHILGKVSDRWNEGDPNDRTNRHGYAYGVRF